LENSLLPLEHIHYACRDSSLSAFPVNLELRHLLFQESLKYRLLGSEGDIGSWEHEYVRYD
jgi:hypothetical protein